VTLSAERSRDRNLAGPATALFTVPGGGASPFAGPVLLYRYLTEADPLRLGQTKDTVHAGATLRGAIRGWRWDATAAFDQVLTDGFGERGVDLAAAQGAIAAGSADPFRPLNPALLGTRLVDSGRQRTRVGNAKAVATGAPFALPAGDATLTAIVEAERAEADSSSRGSSPSDLSIGRTRTEGGAALDLPIASRRTEVLPFLGDLSVNVAGAVRRVGGAGTLTDWSYGATWGLLKGVQLIALSRHAEAAAPLDRLSSPPVALANVPVFDFGSGRTELTTALLGGNPDLRPERRDVRSVQLTAKPFEARELRFSATYEATTIRDQTGLVYALTPSTEAILPELFSRDAAGRLQFVSFRPLNFFRERQRTLTGTVTLWGQLGRAPPPGAEGKPPERATYYAGIGPSLKLSDRLQLRPGTPALDVLDGETITGSGTARASGYGYGGINKGGNGLTFDFWLSDGSRVRSDDPGADLRFLPIFRLNLGGTIAVHGLVGQEWTRKLQLKLDVTNVTGARQRVVDATGAVPNRFQGDYLDPIGRMVRLSLRKLF
jgi:iron complex outermembrane recepter protein